jgi:hypothetical protein
MPHRIITDLFGARWQVWDTKPGPRSKVSPGLSDGWLTFEAVDAEVPQKRRVVPIPDEWSIASDAELIAMLTSAKPVSHSRRTTAVALEESSAPPAMLTAASPTS